MLWEWTVKIFNCDKCHQLVFFDNVSCLNCGCVLGFAPDTGKQEALQPAGGSEWASVADGQRRYRRCRNSEQEHVCNWLVPAEQAHDLCLCCRLNRTIPDLSVDLNRQRWARLEAAKRRLVYGLLSRGLPLTDRLQDPSGGLVFDFMTPEAGPVMTGHAEGVITINAAEADDEYRELQRVKLNEAYRTLLGHLRHESGHYYWDRLIANSVHLEPCRKIFGDERLDYGQALEKHHQEGAPADWLERGFISAYASSHPWEDWAECWGHYLHLCDTLDTAQAFGIKIQHLPASPISLQTTSDFAGSLEEWIPLTLALNSLNRSMGLQDLYPFVLSEAVMNKLTFIHELVATVGRGQPAWSGSGQGSRQLTVHS